MYRFSKYVRYRTWYSQRPRARDSVLRKCNCMGWNRGQCFSHPQLPSRKVSLCRLPELCGMNGGYPGCVDGTWVLCTGSRSVRVH